MNSSRVFNILLFGENKTVKKFCIYLGFNSKNQSNTGIAYFEFPNEKFTHRKFLRLFKFKLKFFILQQNIIQNQILLSNLNLPKGLFKDIHAIILLANNATQSVTEECIEYFNKFTLTRKLFVPLLLFEIIR